MLLDAHTAAEQVDPAAPLAMLLHHFDLIVQTPADVDKLDAAILQLAVEGKLVVGTNHANQGDTGLLPDSNSVHQRGWKTSTIGEIMSFEYGKGLPQKSRNSEGRIPVYGSNGVVGYHTEALVNEPAIVVGRKGSAGALNIAPEPFWPIDTAYYVIPPEDMDIKFVYYLLGSLGLETLGKGIKPGLSRSEAYNLNVTIPPLAEQKRIVARVDELRRHAAALRAELAAAAQDAVTVNSAALNRLHTAENAEAFAAAWQTLSHAFDPLYSLPQNLTALRQTILQLAVQGKLVPQDPNDEPATELIKRIEVEKERLYDEKRLPLLKKPPKVHPDDIPFGIPDGWIWVRSSDVCLSINDGDHLPPPKTESGVPFLVISNIRTGQLDFSNTRFVSHDYYKNLNPSRKPQIGDILYSIVGSLGIPVLMETDLIFCFQRHIALFRPGTEVNSKYMYYLLMSPFVFQQSRDYATGIAQLTIPLSGLRKLLFPIPPLAEQERIVAKVDELLALCDLLEGELIEAEAVRARVVDAVLAGV